jgi:hypothetical protein
VTAAMYDHLFAAVKRRVETSEALRTIDSIGRSSGLQDV